MLNKTARLTNSSDFARTTKSGARLSSINFVGYLYVNQDSNSPARAGLIISKRVGNSVSRHKLARKIRHCLRDQYATLPKGALLVIRALNNSTKADCATEVTNIVGELVKKTTERFVKK